MLISFFKKSFVVQYIVLLVIHGLLWLPAFMAPENFQHSFSASPTPGSIMLHWLLDGHPLAAIILAFLLILFSGIVLNFTLINNGLAGKNSLITALLFYMLAAHQPWLLQMHEGLIPAFILIFIMYLIFDLYTREEAYSHVFHAGFLLAMATLFYFPMVLFILMVFFTFIVYRLFKWCEWVILIFGFLTIYIFVFTTYFWFDQLPGLLGWLDSGFQHIHLLQLPSSDVLGYIIEVSLILLFGMAFFVSGSHLNEKVISIRKRYWAIIWVFIFSLLSFVFSGERSGFHLLILALPMTCIFAFYLSEIRKGFWANILLLIMLFLIVINNFYSGVQNQYF